MSAIRNNIKMTVAASLLLCACDTVDFSACQDEIVVRQQTGNSCPALECACREFDFNGRIRDDGCYEYEHPTTGEVTVDCECRIVVRPVRGGGSNPPPVFPDVVVGELELAAFAEGQSPPAGDLATSIGIFEGTRTASRRVLGEEVVLPTECEEAAAEGNCSRLDCLCEWFLDHLQDDCLIYEHPVTGEEVVDCGCHLGLGPDDDGSPNPGDILDGLVGDLSDRLAPLEPADGGSPPHGDLTAGGLVEEFSGEDAASASETDDTGARRTRSGMRRSRGSQ